MVSLKFLFIVALLATAVSCSENDSNNPIKSKPKKNNEVETPAPQAPVAEADPQNETETSTPAVNDKNLDVHTALLIQEVKNQVANDSAAANNTTANVEFANRIFKINYKAGKRPTLKFVTHGTYVYNFELVNTKGNSQFLNAYSTHKNNLHFGTRSIVYAAEVKSVLSSDSKALTIIKIKDVKTNAIVHVFHMKRAGTLYRSFLPGYNYESELTKNSKVFLENLLKNNSVEGEFYSVITETKNASNASSFSLTVSDNFVLSGYFRAEHPDRIPLLTDYKSAWRLFFLGDAGYMVIKDPSYRIESDRNPMELTALNLDIQVDAKEKIKSKNNTLPVKILIQFK